MLFACVIYNYYSFYSLSTSFFRKRKIFIKYRIEKLGFLSINALFHENEDYVGFTSHASHIKCGINYTGHPVDLCLLEVKPILQTLLD